MKMPKEHKRMMMDMMSKMKEAMMSLERALMEEEPDHFAEEEPMMKEGWMRGMKGKMDASY